MILPNPETCWKFNFSIPPRNADTPGIEFTEYVPAVHLDSFIERAQKNTEFVNYRYLFPTQAGIKIQSEINSSQKRENRTGSERTVLTVLAFPNNISVYRPGPGSREDAYASGGMGWER